MEAKGWMFLQALLNRYHKGSLQPLLKYLPQEEAETLAKYPIESHDVSLAVMQPEQLIQKVHYSWLVPEFNKLPDSLKPFVLASLPPSYSQGIQKLLTLSPSNLQLISSFRNLFLDRFFKGLSLKPDTPVQFLPTSKLTPLLEFTKHQLVELVDFMGLQDLADEIRHIVDKRKLKRIYLCLSPKKQKFLQTCLHQKEKVPSSPLGLEKWDGSSQKLINALHRRGLSRLGMALSGQNPEIIGHIIHRLDSGRGQILKKAIDKDEIPHLTLTIIMQVLNLIKFLYKQG